MQLKTYFAQDASGNIIPNAQVFVYLAGTTTLASGIVDQDGAPLTNPFNADSSAAVVFAAPDGEYDVKCSGASRTVTIRAQLFDGGAFKAALAASGGSALVGADDGAGGSLWTTVAGFIAFLLSSLGSSVIGFLQSGAGAVWRSIQDMLRERLSITQFGAVAAAGVDNTTAIQNAINEALASGKALHVPAASVPFEHGELSVPYDPTKRLRIVGDHGISYFSNAKTSALKFTGTSGYAITVQGRPGGSGGPNQGSPVSFELGRVAFIGNASCDGALRIARGWFAKIENNAFFGFSKTTGGVVAFDAGDVDSGGTSFAGSSYVENNTFASSGRCIVLTGATGGQVNAMTIRGNKMLDQSYGVISSFSVVPYAEHVIIEGNHFEGTLESDIYSQGAASNWVIERNYFEQNNAAKNSPRVWFEGSANYAITVERNTFSKQLQAAGQALVRIANARGVSVKNNVSNYGGQTDRYSVDLITCTDAEAQAMPSAGSATPYPVLMNNYNIRTGTIDDKWRTPLSSAVSFYGISSGDGWPGGTSQTISAIQNKTNGFVNVQFNTTITTKSASGTSVLIGLLPLANNGPEVRFPVVTENVTGTKPFYAVLLNGGVNAQVYDANGTALNYQTAVAVGSKFFANLQYITQS